MNFIISVLLMSLTLSSFLAAEPAVRPFFRASKQQPYHLSVGAVLFNDEGLIACHHFKEIFGYQDIYILMRESMENDETPIMTLNRGLKEEFAAAGHPVAFLGSLSGYLPDHNLSFDKTTIYIACKLTEWDPGNRDQNDPEGSSIIEWKKPEDLIDIMKRQGERFHHRADVDESEMIQRAIPFIKKAMMQP